MLWYDTANNTLKMRSEADDAWINLGTLDQSLGTFTPAGVTGISTDSDLAGVDPTLLTTRGTIATAIAATVPTTSQVLTATSGATAGAVGTYAFGRAGTSKVLGDTLAGSSITTVGTTGYYENPTSSGYLAITGATLAGTWMCMGRSGTVSFQVNIGGGDTATVNVSMSTLWLRIV